MNSKRPRIRRERPEVEKPVNYEAIEKLAEAQGFIDDSIELIEEALMLVANQQLMNEAKAYLIPQLKMAARKEHEYLASSICNNIDYLVEGIQKGGLR